MTEQFPCKVCGNPQNRCDCLICPECGERAGSQDFDVLGADDGNVFCPACGREVLIMQAIIVNGTRAGITKQLDSPGA